MGFVWGGSGSQAEAGRGVEHIPTEYIHRSHIVIHLGTRRVVAIRSVDVLLPRVDHLWPRHSKRAGAGVVEAGGEAMSSKPQRETR